MEQRGDNVVAQSFYLAQLQACKGTCKCNVCQILRKASDQMTEDLLKGNPGSVPDVSSLVKQLEAAGYGVTPPAPVEDRG